MTSATIGYGDRFVFAGHSTGQGGGVFDRGGGGRLAVACVLTFAGLALVGLLIEVYVRHMSGMLGDGGGKVLTLGEEEQRGYEMEDVCCNDNEDEDEGEDEEDEGGSDIGPGKASVKTAKTGKAGVKPAKGSKAGGIPAKADKAAKAKAAAQTAAVSEEPAAVSRQLPSELGKKHGSSQAEEMSEKHSSGSASALAVVRVRVLV